jgi:hypothetical protein
MKVRTLNHDALWHGMAVKFRKYCGQFSLSHELLWYCKEDLFYYLHFKLDSRLYAPISNQVDFELKNTEIHEKE